MTNRKMVSQQTERNWWIDASLFLSAALSVLSGIYFLYLPVGGYQGGRNPWYGITILFDRHTWEDLHTWGGLAMVIIATIHLALHWNWVVNMIRRTISEIRGQCGCMNARGRFNLWLNAVVALSFILTALSGLYFFFWPAAGGAQTPAALFGRTVWDLIHTWAGVTLIAAAVLHFAIHWRWVTKVTRKVWDSRRPWGKADRNPAASSEMPS